MTVPTFEFPMIDRFIDRVDELARLESWWNDDDALPINLFGRRRVGKSWLFRRFAHGKPAILLVAHKVAPGAQLATFARALEPILGVVPELPDLASLFSTLYRIARDERVLVVIDEFPWLLPSGEQATDRALTAVQAVIEHERDRSQLKLILCGSAIKQMEAMQTERNPLFGRFAPLHLRPLAFAEASLFLTELDPISRFERFAITGGMPRYLTTLGADRSLRSALAHQVLNHNAALWDEARTVLEQELGEPRLHFAILESLATGDKELNEIAQSTRVPATSLSKYLNVLSDLGIVDRRLPIGARLSARGGHWHLLDPFFRFWFRFVFPYQDELENGLSGNDLFDAIISEQLHDHVAGEFERWCQRWTRTHRGTKSPTVGSWWGAATKHGHTSAGRHTEEIDIVGIRQGRRVSIVGEAKWRTRKLDATILRDLYEYKLPALEAAGFTLDRDLEVLLFARAGYSASLRAAADRDQRVTLVDVAAALAH